MRATYLSKPTPHDPAAAAQEAERRESLKLSDPVQRGIRMAQRQALDNARGEVNQRLSDLKKTSLKRDYSQAARDAYNRGHANLVKAAERLAAITGNGVTIPQWLPPPTSEEAPTEVIGAPPEDGRYKETKGMKGGGLPLRVPGSAVDPDWMTK